MVSGLVVIRAARFGRAVMGIRRPVIREFGDRPYNAPVSSALVAHETRGEPLMTRAVDCPPSQPATPPVDLAAVKKRQQATWASGDFSVIGTTLQWVGESLCEA